MSDTWVGPGWWLASDGRWYPPAIDNEHNDALDAVLTARATDEPVVIDLRNDDVVVSVPTPAKDLVPPPLPIDVQPAPAAPSSTQSAPVHGRWGGHRRVATPVRARSTQ